MSRHTDTVRTTVVGLCMLVGCSRQAYYKDKHVRSRQAVETQAIMELVREQRKIHPRIGVRKILFLIEPELAEMGISIGRDRLFALLREHGLLVKRRSRCAKTTDSLHGFHVWPNLIRNIVPSMPHQVWVSDLTYIRTDEGFMYLSLITDAYSRKIVGSFASDSLETYGCIRALDMALAQLPEGACPIHHSDRGTQYCCGDYIKLLQRHECLISMTENNHCYENAKAERVNGILKDEYGLGQTFRSKRQAACAARQAIAIYNERRPHTKLNFQTPAYVHAREEAA